ncbi:50S ribosomal protein L23 [Thiococcus pfennigii]|jgi:large subunit ribosomal protein L23|uniref:50S ribosomal protein L23 n=1 Tax=Thiococcus pfennigii TaxID=1057 RepID=UPI0019067501|nr:50S ribosomal protein L23 [Thiococcus pfennigii]MBK1699891.1 50S ribosomal protein L23 [Thiococcus pfennigii]MBK1731048.1 50S ribosomal protein L23 [Thiococcus pfennigii]
MNKERLSKVLLSPVVSEKASRGAETASQFAFRVTPDATKREIARAVEAMFGVAVDRVQVLNVKGKAKRFGRLQGKRKDWRKAYVRLMPGHDIDFGGGA